jgi:hypothetical protein
MFCFEGETEPDFIDKPECLTLCADCQTRAPPMNTVTPLLQFF